jgi:hypothetical protein
VRARVVTFRLFMTQPTGYVADQLARSYLVDAIMLGVGKQLLQVALEDHELAQIQASAQAQGRSLQDYARDTLLTAAMAQATRRGTLHRVIRISDALNQRLAQ